MLSTEHGHMEQALDAFIGGTPRFCSLLGNHRWHDFEEAELPTPVVDECAAPEAHRRLEERELLVAHLPCRLLHRPLGIYEFRDVT